MRIEKFVALLTAFVLMVTLVGGCQSPSGTASPSPATSEPASVSPNPEPSSPELSYEEGTSPADDIVNTVAADKVLLVVSFGTSYNESRSLTIGGIETALKETYPDYQVRRAFTSQIIIDKLAERDNLRVDSVTEAMNRLVLDKVKEVVVQPTTVLNGFEYDDMIAEVTPFAGEFDSLKIGKHLLADDIDYDQVAEEIVGATSQYRNDDTAIVFMGHGTEHEAGAAYTKLQDVLVSKGYDDYIIGTVEHSVELDQVQEMLREKGVKKVVLQPLMVVAGDHANNDMAGDEEDSWKTVLTEEGYEVEIVLEGLGQIKGIQEIYIRHVKDALASATISAIPTAAPAAAGIGANRIKNGVYDITATTDTSMFKIVECQINVEDTSITARITLSGQGYAALYNGTVENRLSEGGEDYGFTLEGERHTFTMPIEALDREVNIAALGKKSGTWYDHVVLFSSMNMPDTAFLPVSIDVSLTGGTGRASVQSPARLTYVDGKNMAEVVWSSPNYTYMVIDGVKYLPVNSEGNSVFEIPVDLDTDINVIACTVAMSSPKEIEYVLRFDWESIGEYK